MSINVLEAILDVIKAVTCLFIIAFSSGFSQRRWHLIG